MFKDFSTQLRPSIDHMMYYVQQFWKFWNLKKITAWQHHLLVKPGPAVGQLSELQPTQMAKMGSS